MRADRSVGAYVMHPLARRSLRDLSIPPPYAAYHAGRTERMYTNPYGGRFRAYPTPRPDALQERYAAWLMSDLAQRGQASGLTGENVLFTAGSVAGIELLVRTFCEPGEDTICIQSPVLPIYALHARAEGGAVVDVPLGGPNLDCIDIGQVCDAKAKLTFLCRPHNPAGTAPAWADVLALADGVAGLLVVDEAYMEFCNLLSAASLAGRSNIAVLRTFSKAWGLAGVRAGVVLAHPDVIQALRVLADPFAFDTPAQDAISTALDAPERALAAVPDIRRQRDTLAIALSAVPGVRVLPSEANFLFLYINSSSSPLPASDALVAPGPFPGSLRVAIGTPADDAAAITLVARLASGRACPVPTLKVPTKSVPPSETTLTPPEVMRRFITSYFISQAIYVVAKLDLAQHFAAGSRTAEQIASLAGLHAGALHRLLRALADAGVFVETAPGWFALTELGQTLRESVPGSMRAAAVLFNEEPYRACGELLTSIRTGETAFDRMYGKRHFEYLAENPDAARTFHRAMTQLTTLVCAAIVAGYDFSEIGRLVDVGGGEGLLLQAILQASPSIQGVLFEAPSALPGARRVIEEAGLAGRCEIVSGDFFEAVPEGADLYLLKSVLHDWDDARARAILANCRRAIPDHGRILVIERVIPPGSGHFFGRLNDLVMLVVSGGCERTEAEYAELLATTGFQLLPARPTGTGFHILEGVPI